MLKSRLTVVASLTIGVIFEHQNLNIQKTLITLLVICFFKTTNAQLYKWHIPIGSDYNDKGRKAIIDSLDNVYITGTIDGTADFDNSAGVQNITSAGSLDIFLAKYDRNGSLLWAKAIGGWDTDVIYDIALDDSSNIYLCGDFGNGFTPDPGAGFPLLYPTGVSDAFFAKYSTNGNCRWVKTIGGYSGSGNVGARALTLDNLHNIYIAGYFNTTADFDPSVTTQNLVTNGQNDGFFAKYDNAGNYLWAKSIGGTGFDAIEEIKVSELHNVFITGSFNGSVDFDPGVPSNIKTALGKDAFVAKYNGGGNFQWVNQIRGLSVSAYSHSYAIALDSSENVITTGIFAYPTDFDSGTTTATLTTSTGDADTYFAKYSSNGNYVFAKSFGSTVLNVSDGGNSVAIDKFGDIYITGLFADETDFDPGIGVSMMSNTGYPQNDPDAFFAKYSVNGDFIWKNKIGSAKVPFGTYNGFDQGLGITVNDSGYVFVAGYVGGLRADFDCGEDSSIYSSVGQMDAFFAKYSQIPDTAGVILGNLFTCINDTVVFTVPSIINATGYSWIIPNSAAIVGGANTNTVSIVFTSTVSPAQISVFGTNGFGTGVPSNKNITILTLPIITLSSDTICISSSATITSLVNGASPFTYAWSNGFLTPAITITPSVNSAYTLSVTDVNNCVGTETVNVVVDNTCADVWPGDANSDETADNLDVLELGLHYTQTGAPRATTSNNWQSYFATNWAGTISNGKNLNQSDCNGDGSINDDDTLAIYNNYGLTHTFKPVQTTAVNPQLSIVPDQAMVVKGMWGTASVYLGDATTPINNINGLAFTVDFDQSLIEPNSVYLEYQNSFMDAGQNLLFRKLDFTNGKIFTASTHTLSNNVNGYGKIATLNYQIKSSLATDELLNIGLSLANQSDASGSIVPLTSGTGTLMAIGASVGIKESVQNGNILISPNPTNGVLNISFSSIPQNTKIELYNGIGALVLSETMSDKINAINTTGLSSGIYFIKVMEGDRIIKVQKVVRE